MSDNSFLLSTWAVIGLTLVGIILVGKSCVLQDLENEKVIKLEAAKAGCTYINERYLICNGVKIEGTN